jgi:hypothetical protein
MAQVLLPSNPLLGTCCNEQPELQVKENTIKRKRVRFDEESETRQVKQRIVDLPTLPSSQLSKAEKSELWLQRADYEASLTAALKDVVMAKSSSIEFPLCTRYADAVAETYTLCCAPDAKTTISIENVALLSLVDSSCRGLESHTLPRQLRVDRKIRKAKAVKRVLELQSELRVSGNPDEDATECLRLVSEFFSEPSRKFARALGEIDGTFVQLDLELSSQRSS